VANAPTAGKLFILRRHAVATAERTCVGLPIRRRFLLEPASDYQQRRSPRGPALVAALVALDSYLQSLSAGVVVFGSVIA